MDSHTHSFSGLAVEPIKRVQKKYKGTPGDMAFLVDKCETCPKVRPRDYGTTKEMEDKLKEIENGEI